MPSWPWVLLLLAVSGMVPTARAEDGYELWLRYPAAPAQWLETYHRAISEVVTGTSSPTLKIATAELARGLTGMLGTAPPAVAAPTREGSLILGTPRSLPLIGKLPLDLAH